MDIKRLSYKTKIFQKRKQMIFKFYNQERYSKGEQTQLRLDIQAGKPWVINISKHKQQKTNIWKS